MKYDFKVKGLYKFSADDATKELDRIKKERGELKAEYIVEEASRENNILHSAFEWDDTEAAHRYRLSQANNLVRSIIVVVEEEHIDLRVYANVRTEKTAPRTIVRIEDYYGNEVAEADLFEQCRRDMQNFINKYIMLKKAKGVINEMLKTL